MREERMLERMFGSWGRVIFHLIFSFIIFKIVNQIDIVINKLD